MKLNTSIRKRFRVSNKVKRVAARDRFRLSISRSAKNISAQIIDDIKKVTLLSASSVEKDLKSVEKVKVILAGNIINIEGPLGKKSINIDLDMFNLDIKEGKEISIKPKKVDQNSKRLWGMNRSLINNAVIGSSAGYEKILELVGVGYRAALKGNQLNLQLGYSHDIDFDIPEGIKISVEKQTTLKITGSDKQLVGTVASKIKTLRKIEPYKGKGIREKGQYVLKKEGKKK